MVVGWCPAWSGSRRPIGVTCWLSKEVRRCYLASVVMDYRVGEGHCPLVETGGLRDWTVMEIQLLNVSGCPQLRLMH